MRFNKTGGIVAAQTTGTSSTFATTTGTWSADNWYRVKIVGTATGLTYYLNDTQIYTGNFFLNYNFDEMAFVHDNYSGSAYIDRIAINNEGGVLSTKDDVKIIKNMLSIYPNPTSDILNIKTDSKINSVSVVDITGKKVNVKLEDGKIDVRSLPAGIYLINVETKDGISTEKFIKKYISDFAVERFLILKIASRLIAIKELRVSQCFLRIIRNRKKQINLLNNSSLEVFLKEYFFLGIYCHECVIFFYIFTKKIIKY